MRNIIKRSFILLFGVGLVIAITPDTASAHERWFVERPNSYKVDFSLLISWQVLAAIVIGGVVVATLMFIDRRYRVWHRAKNPDLENQLAGIQESRLRRVYAFLPLLLAIHTAVPLIVSGFQLQLFAPNLQMQQNFISGLLALAEVLIALALVYGVFTEYAALGLIGLFFVGILTSPFTGLEPLLILDQFLFVGIGAFFWIIGRGPYSADGLLGRQRNVSSLVRYALPALRWGLGITVIILAFSEKLLNPALAEAFLNQKIDFNFTQAFGIPDLVFIYLAGIAEFTFGLVLLSGALPRLVIIAMWIPFNLTLPYLGWVELAGHLPVYAIMLTLLVVGSTSRRATQRSAAILAEETRGTHEKVEEKVIISPRET